MQLILSSLFAGIAAAAVLQERATSGGVCSKVSSSCGVAAQTHASAFCSSYLDLAVVTVTSASTTTTVPLFTPTTSTTSTKSGKKTTTTSTSSTKSGKKTKTTSSVTLITTTISNKKTTTTETLTESGLLSKREPKKTTSSSTSSSTKTKSKSTTTSSTTSSTITATNTFKPVSQPSCFGTATGKAPLSSSCSCLSLTTSTTTVTVSTATVTGPFAIQASATNKALNGSYAMLFGEGNGGIKGDTVEQAEAFVLSSQGYLSAVKYPGLVAEETTTGPVALKAPGSNATELTCAIESSGLLDCHVNGGDSDYACYTENKWYIGATPVDATCKSFTAYARPIPTFE